MTKKLTPSTDPAKDENMRHFLVAWAIMSSLVAIIVGLYMHDLSMLSSGILAGTTLRFVYAYYFKHD